MANAKNNEMRRRVQVIALLFAELDKKRKDVMKMGEFRVAALLQKKPLTAKSRDEMTSEEQTADRSLWKFGKIETAKPDATIEVSPSVATPGTYRVQVDTEVVAEGVAVRADLHMYFPESSSARAAEFGERFYEANQKAQQRRVQAYLERRRKALTVGGDSFLLTDIAEGFSVPEFDNDDVTFAASTMEECEENSELYEGSRVFISGGDEEFDDEYILSRRINQQLAAFRAMKRISQAKGETLPRDILVHGRKLTAWKRKIKELKEQKAAELAAEREKKLSEMWDAERDEVAKQELNKSRPLEETIPAYSDTDLGKQIKAVRESFTGQVHLEHIEKVGELAYKAFCGALQADKESAQMSAIRSKLSDLRERLEIKKREIEEAHRYNLPSAKVLAREYSAMAKSFNRLIDKRQSVLTPYYRKISKITAGFVGSVRPLCDRSEDDLRTVVTDDRTFAGKHIRDAYKLLPKELAEALIARGALRVETTTRGYFDAHSSFDRIGCDDDPSTALHENMHRLEKARPEIVSLEREFFAKRTKGEELKTLREVTGLNYRETEVCKRDEFLNAYMGKDYGGNSYELISMGVEMLYFQPEELKQDPDFAKFILGIVLTL